MQRVRRPALHNAQPLTLRAARIRVRLQHSRPTQTVVQAEAVFSVGQTLSMRRSQVRLLLCIQEFRRTAMTAPQKIYLQAQTARQALQLTSLPSPRSTSRCPLRASSRELLTAAPSRRMCRQTLQMQAGQFTGAGIVYLHHRAGGRRCMQHLGLAHELSYKLLFSNLLPLRLSPSPRHSSQRLSTVRLLRSYRVARPGSSLAIMGWLRRLSCQPLPLVAMARLPRFFRQQRKLRRVEAGSSLPVLVQWLRQACLRLVIKSRPLKVPL